MVPRQDVKLPSEATQQRLQAWPCESVYVCTVDGDDGDGGVIIDMI